MQFVAIDFETANEKRFSPCSIGVVVANEKEIVDEFYSLINPMQAFHSYNTYIHGIHEQDVMDAPTFTELWPTLQRYFSNNLVVAHNASFDMSVIRHTLDYNKLAYPDMEYLCTVKLSQQVWPELENHKLDTLAAYHGFELIHHHALEDARLAAQLVIQSLQDSQLESIDSILEKYQMVKGRIYEHGYYPPKLKQVKRKKKLYLR
ncbi:hypothetical protein D8M04_08615 [Oceanobacillus piezotolerans]|uniref:Exonuclease domain-containing protein n=1 Tax=Oceanobacillus piezotolerans TaxID=2448030 RepID=A0A498D8I2_9BACI|nr:3'-5' exonuclease [Oceanobacillus piezotolerans]RLL44931.1 hypothetical protein D8M04_08615 [Oceanobacillus piezotolerans]